MRFIGSTSLALVVLLAAAPGSRASETKAIQAQERGVKAFKSGQYDAAVAALEEALREHADEGRLRKGATFISYVPSRWLAEAHVNLGHCDDAKRYAGRAAGLEMGAEDKNALRQVQERIARECDQPKPTAPTPTAPTTAPTVAIPTATAPLVAIPTSPAPTAVRPGPEVTARLDPSTGAPRYGSGIVPPTAPQGRPPQPTATGSTQVPDDPHAALRIAWGLLAEGQPEAAIDALQGTTLTPQGRMVLACSLATRALLQADLDGRPKAADAARARAEWKAASGALAKLSLDKPWISPRVRELLEAR